MTRIYIPVYSLNMMHDILGTCVSDLRYSYCILFRLHQCSLKKILAYNSLQPNKTDFELFIITKLLFKHFSTKLLQITLFMLVCYLLIIAQRLLQITLFMFVCYLLIIAQWLLRYFSFDCQGF